MTTMTSLQGLAERRQRSSRQTAGAPRGCTPAEARRQPDRKRADYRGGEEHAEGAGWTFHGRRLALCPGPD